MARKKIKVRLVAEEWYPVYERPLCLDRLAEEFIVSERVWKKYEEAMVNFVRMREELSREMN